MIINLAFILVASIILFFIVVKFLLGLTLIKSDEVAVIEKWWSTKGNLPQGQLISLNGEAGFQPELKRAGVHFLPRFMFKVHKYPMIVIPQGQIGYVFANDGIAMSSTQLLGADVDCQNFQDTRAFLLNGGQKGPQRAILRDGAYAINLAQFAIITKNKIHRLEEGSSIDEESITTMMRNIEIRKGFEPVIIKEYVTEEISAINGKKVKKTRDIMGIVTTHEGKGLGDSDVIAPIVGTDPSIPETYHNSFQSPEAFLKAGGYKGKQYQVITDGTYYINRLFATVELIDKTIIPMGYVGVVNSFAGEEGTDVSGDDYKHGELVEKGYKGICVKALQPGKYAFNTRAGSISLVPTTNIILKWEKGTQGDHNFDSNLKEVTLITKDAFEPTLPLSVVIHIDYNKAPYVIQRFGDIKMLVEQSLDPLISAYFKNIAQKKTLIELIQERSEMQTTATEEMRKRFAEYNLNLVEVLIGTPDANGDEKIEGILSQLSDRQIAKEQLVTFESKMEASKKERELREFEAKTEQQAELTKSAIAIEIQENKGKAELQKANQDALKIAKLADAEAQKTERLAQAQAFETDKLSTANATAKLRMKKSEAEGIKLNAEAEAQSVEQIGLAKAKSVREQVNAYGDISYMIQEEAISKISGAIERGQIPLVPQNLVSIGGDGKNSNAVDTMQAFIGTLIGEKIGVKFTDNSKNDTPEKKEITIKEEAVSEKIQHVEQKKENKEI